MYKRIILALLLISSLSVIMVFGQSREGDSLALVELYDSTNGDEWTNNTNWKSGTIDTWHGVTVSGDRVTRLSLINNNLTGTIPSSIGDLSDLTNLALDYNNLTGTIPPSIGNLENLEHLGLDVNSLTGSIPVEIGNLTNLTHLFIQANELTGSIPTSIGSMASLFVISLNDNQLTGSIPPEVGNLENLAALDLRINFLANSIPSEIGDLSNLEFLHLNNNQFTGSVPIEIQNLTKLQSLYLHNNELIGLPSLADLTSLVNLRIQNNKFTFEDIEPNISVASDEFNYSPQDSVGEDLDTTINEGSSLTMTVSVGGENNEYQWKKNESVISSATDSSYTISSAEADDSGSYICEITNTVATELTLYSRSINLTVNTSGVLDGLPTVYSMNVRRVAANKKFEVRYSIPEKTSVKLGVYSINGTKVKEFSEEKAPGIYSKEIDMKNSPAGIYFVKMEADGEKFSRTEKLILVN